MEQRDDADVVADADANELTRVSTEKDEEKKIGGKNNFERCFLKTVWIIRRGKQSKELAFVLLTQLPKGLALMARQWFCTTDF